MATAPTVGLAPEKIVIGMLVVLAGAIAASVLLWLGGEVAALLWMRRWPAAGVTVAPRIAIGILGHLGSPREAWPSAVRQDIPGPGAVYAVWLGMIAAAAAVGAPIARRLLPLAANMAVRMGVGSRPGFASPRDINATLGRGAVRTSLPIVRPSLGGGAVSLHDAGIDVGRSVQGGVSLWGSFEDSYLVLGPPRCGKGTSFLIPTLARFPGPAVVTSTRDDIFQHTALARSRPGPVYLFDPTEVCSWPRRVRWSPIEGCDDPLVAILRARALVRSSGAGKNVTNGDFWSGSAETVLRCYLHAAAVGRCDMRTVLRWVAQQQSPEPTELLRRSPTAGAWAADLASVAQAHVQPRSAIFASVGLALSVLADPRVLQSCSPDQRHPGFNPTEFRERGGTLYVTAHSGAQLSMAPLISALVESIVDEARRAAAGRPGGRLDPPLGLILDEAAQIAPLPSLPSLIADGGGSGITTITVLQSLAQARNRWGHEAADAMWDSCTVRLLFAGLGNDRDLERISKLCGDVDETTRTISRGNRDHWNESTSVRRVPVLSVADIRGLASRRPLVLYRGMRAVQTSMPGWWDRPEYARIVGPAYESMEATLGDRRGGGR